MVPPEEATANGNLDKLLGEQETPRMYWRSVRSSQYAEQEDRNRVLHNQEQQHSILERKQPSLPDASPSWRSRQHPQIHVLGETTQMTAPMSVQL